MSMPAVLEWIWGLPKASSARPVEPISSEARCCKRDLKQSMFPSSLDSVLQKFGPEQVRQLMRASSAFHLYEKSDGRIAGSFLTLFRDKAVTVMKVNRGR